MSGLSAAFAAACYGSPVSEEDDTENWEQAAAQFDAAARRAAWKKFWRRFSRGTKVPTPTEAA